MYACGFTQATFETTPVTLNGVIYVGSNFGCLYAINESNGTVRIFQNGEVTLRIEPFRRPMKWKDFEYEPPPAE